MGLRAALSRLRVELRCPHTWLLAAALVLASPLCHWLWTLSFGHTPAAESEPDLLVVGILIGLYLGFKVALSSAFLVDRLSGLDRPVMRWTLLSTPMAVMGACAQVGDRLGSSALGVRPAGLSTWPEWALSTLLLAALASALLPWCANPGRCSLAVVAVAWWIPAILPPSFLVAVPRALRGAFEGGRALALPSDPVGWLADTALAAGLLLLAWAPRSSTFRGDEVRHPG